MKLKDFIDLGPDDSRDCNAFKGLIIAILGAAPCLYFVLSLLGVFKCDC